MATISNFAFSNTGGAASLTTSYGSTATAGNMLTASIIYDVSFNISTITSVKTVGGTGQDTLSLVQDYPGIAGNLSSMAFFAVPSCGAGRTGIIATYSNGSFFELAIWETSGIASPVADVIFTATPAINATSISGTTGSLAASVEAAFCFSVTSIGFSGYPGAPDTGNPFTAGSWTWDVTSGFTGSAYGHQVTSSATGLATTLKYDGSGPANDGFGVVTFRAAAGSVASASGSGTASAVGKSTATSTTSSSGTGTATAVGRSAATSGASSSGVGTASGVGKSTATSVGTSSGTGVATGLAISIAASVGTLAGSSVATGVAISAATSVGSSSGSGAALGVGSSTGGGSAGTVTGIATASGVGISTVTSVASAAGISGTSGVAASIATSVGTSSGVGTAAGVTATVTASIGTSSGVGAASATGIFATGSIATALGFSTVTGVGSSIASAVGTCSGVASVLGLTDNVSFFSSGRWIDDSKKIRPPSDAVRQAAAILSKMGGHARAASLTSTQRSNIASTAAKARWR